MSERRVVVKFDRAVLGGGAELLGVFAVEGGDFGDLKSLELSVLWQTEGKGEQDRAVVEYRRWGPDTGEALDLSKPQEFTVVLPPTPLSYDGQLLSIRWLARVRARWADGEESLGEAPFRLGRD